MSIPPAMYHVICIKRLYKTFFIEFTSPRLNSFSAVISGPQENVPKMSIHRSKKYKKKVYIHVIYKLYIYTGLKEI